MYIVYYSFYAKHKPSSSVSGFDNSEQKIILSYVHQKIPLHKGSTINFKAVKKDILGPSYGCLKFTKYTCTCIDIHVYFDIDIHRELQIFNNLYCKIYLCAKLLFSQILSHFIHRCGKIAWKSEAFGSSQVPSVYGVCVLDSRDNCVLASYM